MAKQQNYDPSRDPVLNRLMAMEQKMDTKTRKNKEVSMSEVKEFLDMAKDQLVVKEDITREWFSERDINMDALDSMYEKYEGEYTEESDAVIIAHFRLLSGEKTESFLKEYEHDREESRVHLMKEMIREMFAEKKDLLEDRKTIEDIERDVNVEVQKFSEYASSVEYDKDQESLLQRLTELLNSMGDDGASHSDKKKLSREIEVIKQRYSLEYVYARLLDPATHDNEVDAIVKCFFDRNRSGYVMSRFRSRCEQMHLSDSIQRHLLNIEENFLEEKFHVFNNLYLFYIMRYVGHGDPSASREVKQPIRCMINLVYHKFYSDEVRETFLSSMRGFLSHFEKYRELFEQKNILHPKHPHRVAKDAEMAAMRKMELGRAITTEFDHLHQRNMLMALNPGMTPEQAEGILGNMVAENPLTVKQMECYYDELTKARALAKDIKEQFPGVEIPDDIVTRDELEGFRASLEIEKLAQAAPENTQDFGATAVTKTNVGCVELHNDPFPEGLALACGKTKPISHKAIGVEELTGIIHKEFPEAEIPDGLSGYELGEFYEKLREQK